MKLPLHKTKIVCTIGPTSISLPIIEELVNSGMNVARLNFSHGSFEEQKEKIDGIRQVAEQLKRNIPILIDLPGAKMRVGKLKIEPMMLKRGESIVLTTNHESNQPGSIPIEYKQLSASVSKGRVIYLNDGFIQLAVEEVIGEDVYCKVIIGGRLLSHKGLNLPGAKLFVDAITEHDLEIVKFGLSNGVSIFGLSFVEKPEDILKVRDFASSLGKKVFLIAKIERREAIENFEAILKVADGVMIARGDMGVEIPIEEVPTVQKSLIQKANAMGKPVITATQLLESMTHNIRPTRAEVNDVANAILDGTDAVMLSEETAIGEYPVETVRMMSKIIAFTEESRQNGRVSNDEGAQVRLTVARGHLTITDVISLNAVRSAEDLKARYILSPTTSGSTARRISRFKPSCWILAFSSQPDICEYLSLSFGVYSFVHPHSHQVEVILKDIQHFNLAKPGDIIVITERGISDKPGDTDTLEILTLE